MKSTTARSRGRLPRKQAVILGLVAILLRITADLAYRDTLAPYGIQPDSTRDLSRKTNSRPGEPSGETTMRQPDTAASRGNFIERETKSGGKLDVFPNRKFQIMQGFGSTVRLFDDPHLSETWDPGARRASALLSRAQQDEIMKLVYGELGLTRIRPATDADVEKSNDNAL